MDEEKQIRIRRILSDGQYLTDNLIPVACFSIADILKQLNKVGKGTGVFELVKLESSMLSFCAGCWNDEELRGYILEVEKLLSSDFSLEIVEKAANLFERMYREYVERRLSSVTVMKAI